MMPLPAYHEALARDAAAFIAVVRSADPDSPVPACPGWTMVDLGRHLGQVHRWAAEIVRTGSPAIEPASPADPAELGDWLAEGAADLVHILLATDAGRPTWTFGPPPRTASFWSRRQAQETAVHLVDARRATGVPVHLDPELAADGVDEIATVLFPRQVRLERIPPLTRGLRVVLTDVPDAAWTIAGDGTEPDAPADVVAAGSAADVLLVRWGRADLDSLAVDGDADAARAVIAAGITP